MTSNSIMYPRVSILLTFLCTYTASNLIKDTLAASKNNYKEMEVLDDLPEKINMDFYLTKLEKVLLFAKTHKRYIDMNLCFGLFLININLRTISRIRRTRISDIHKKRLDRILATNDQLIGYFKDMMLTLDKRNYTDSLLHITDLFTEDEKNWSKHLQIFREDLLKKTKFLSKRELNTIYSKQWSQYVDKVYDFDKYSPSPNHSDYCIGSLSKNPANNKLRWEHCQVPNSCSEIMYSGTDYGYGITHRLLFFLMARFSRGCTIISAAEDKRTVDNYCATIYNEAEYHSHNNFQLPDLALEQIALCALEGHVQFLRRSWLEELFDYQNDMGCVASSPSGKEIKPVTRTYSIERPVWRVINEEQDIMAGACNTHTTGVAGAVISSVIRYIIEKY